MDFNHRSFHRSLSSSSQGPALSMSSSIYRKGGTEYLRVAPSVYGGAGGHGTRTSTSRHMVSYGSDLAEGNLCVGNEKMTMKNLNDRLASYLEKVRPLESNSKLELQIKRWYETNTPGTCRDHSAYLEQIKELRNQIKDAQLQNARRVLQIDNAKLAAKDFRLKYESERGICLAVVADLQGLKMVYDDQILMKTDLEIQTEGLNKDLMLLQKEHEEEVRSLRAHLGNKVNVEVDAVPGPNLSAIMSEMRQKYEAMAQENLQKAKEQYETQIETLQQQVTVSTEELKESRDQRSVRRIYQSLEIQLQSHLSLKEALEHTLEETNARYCSHLAIIQTQLNCLEGQLVQIRTNTEHQSHEYNILLDIKSQLEQEIATYRCLLEGEDVKTTEYQLSTLEERDKYIKKTRKIKTVVQEVVDSKTVSSKVKEVEESM
ncbi:LOW QUALITY PROTEIN: keratin, type I cytoskeletal 20 [Megaptera novaeangliae]